MQTHTHTHPALDAVAIADAIDDLALTLSHAAMHGADDCTRITLNAFSGGELSITLQGCNPIRPLHFYAALDRARHAFVHLADHLRDHRGDCAIYVLHGDGATSVSVLNAPRVDGRPRPNHAALVWK